MHVAQQIGLDYAPVVLDRHVLEAANDTHADAAEPDVDAAEHIPCLDREAGDGIGIGDIDDMDVGNATGLRAAPGDVLEPGLASRREDELDPRRREGNRGGRADPARTAGDDDAPGGPVHDPA
jgi:hypothetical protein